MFAVCYWLAIPGADQLFDVPGSAFPRARAAVVVTNEFSEYKSGRTRSILEGNRGLESCLTDPACRISTVHTSFLGAALEAVRFS